MHPDDKSAENTRPFAVWYNYQIGEIVTVKPINERGRVVSLWCSDKGVQYEVAWWCNGERQSAYIFEDEIESVAK